MCQTDGIAKMKEFIMNQADSNDSPDCSDRMGMNILMATDCTEVGDALPADCQNAEAENNVAIMAAVCTAQTFPVWRAAMIESALADAGAGGSGSGSGSASGSGSGGGSGGPDFSDDTPCTLAQLQKFVDMLKDQSTCADMQQAFVMGLMDKSLTPCDPGFETEPMNCKSEDDLNSLKSQMQNALNEATNGGAGDSSDDPCTQAELQKYVDAFEESKTCGDLQAALEKNRESLPDCDPGVNHPQNCKSDADVTQLKSDLQEANDKAKKLDEDPSAASSPLVWLSMVLPAMALLAAVNEVTAVLSHNFFSL